MAQPSSQTPPNTPLILQRERQKSTNGKLIATILSAYDLHANAEPKGVVLETLGQRLCTGPPIAKHKDKNAFRYVGNSNNTEQHTSSCELIVNAPLSALYSATLKFTVTLASESNGDSIKELVTISKVSNIVRVNETQWLILTLRDPNKQESTNGESNPSSSSTAIEPTLRIKIRLEGPYRQEVSALISACNTWFHTVDHLSSHATNALGSTINTLSVDLPEKFPAAKLLLVPAVPLTAICIGGLPIIAGLCIVGLPFFLPLLMIVALLTALIGTVSTGLYFSTKQGRIQLQDLLLPAFSTFVCTSVGQRFIYDTGPRPSPTHVLQLLLPTSMTSKLFASFLLDFIGSASYLIPVVGEVFDISWAPLQAMCIAVMYDETMPSLKYISFVEEILPFTDAFPSATAGWLRQYSPALLDIGKQKVMEMSIVLNREKAGVQDFINGN